MKAVLCKEYGPPESLVIEDVPSPVAGAGEIVVTVEVGSSRVDLQACKLEYSIVSPK